MGDADDAAWSCFAAADPPREADPFACFGADPVPGLEPAAGLGESAFGSRSTQVAKIARQDPGAAAAALAEALEPFDGEPFEVPARRRGMCTEAASSSLEAWSGCPPRRLGPVRLAQLPEFGGARGFVAARDILPGEVLLAEEPYQHWPGIERGPLPLLQALLQRPDVPVALEAVSHLHPVDLAQVEMTSRRELEERHAQTISALRPFWAACARGGDGATADGPSPEEALLRLCLAVQWNAFDSGLFLHQAIFNHACARDANCDKAVHKLPSLASGAVGEKVAVSVVRATRHIAAGEQCLISYVQPLELSHAEATRRLEQFDFTEKFALHPLLDRPPEVPAYLDALRASGDGCGSVDSPPLAAEDALAPGADAEASTLWLEADCRKRLRASLRAGAENAETAIVLNALVAACGDRHLAVASARRHVVSAVRRRLQQGNGNDGGDWLLLLECSTELWRTQRLLLGPLHPEGAETLHDIASSLGALLALAPRRLFERFPRWGNAMLASRAEQRALSLHRQIAELYVDAQDDPVTLASSRS